MKNIVVTGSSGGFAPYAIQELLNKGYSVTGADQEEPSSKKLQINHSTVDLSILDDVIDVLKGADAILHLAAFPGGVGRTPEYIYINNVMTTFNILEAAATLGIKKIVLGSSESSYGFYWGDKKALPQYFPLDEKHPRLPTEVYGLTKIINEETADMFHRKTEMQIVSLRFSYISLPEDYPHIIESFSNSEKFMPNLWGSIDARDAASSCRAALETDGLGATAMNITSDTVLSDQPTIDLIKRYYPNVPVRGPLYHQQPLVSNAMAKSLLDWTPVYSWKNYK